RLAVLGRAMVEDLKNVFDMGSVLASQIVDRVQRYRQELQEMPLGSPRSARRERLVALLARLRQAHEQYQKVMGSASDGGAAQKKKLREARNDALLDLRITLARHGELERLEEIERIPFDRKVEWLESYVAELGEVEAPNHG